MNEKGFLGDLEKDFNKIIDRLIKEFDAEIPNHLMDRFVCKFAFDAAQKTSQDIAETLMMMNDDKRRLDSVFSLETTLVRQRLENAWEKFRIANESNPRNFREDLHNLLKELSETDEAEEIISNIEDPGFVIATTVPFAEIMNFLDTH